jgi:hypothetical protein
VALRGHFSHGEQVSTSDRIEEQSFCYDPDFPPDVAEGMPLVAAVAKPEAKPPAVRRVLRALRTRGRPS